MIKLPLSRDMKLLSFYIKKRLPYLRAEAIKNMILEFEEYLVSNLEKHRRVVVPKFGIVKMDKTGKLVFKRDTHSPIMAGRLYRSEEALEKFKTWVAMINPNRYQSK